MGNNTQSKPNNDMGYMTTVFNTAGFIPTASIFMLTEYQLEELIKDISKGYVNDVETVTLDINYKTGRIDAFVWLPRNSDNIRDTSTLSNSSAIKRPLIRFSPAMKDFVDKFCLKDEKRFYESKNGNDLVAFHVGLSSFLMMAFDHNGHEFNKKYGNQKRTPIDLLFEPVFERADDHKYGKFKYIRITKSIKNALGPRRPVAALRI